jgi:hypothetical protein
MVGDEFSNCLINLYMNSLYANYFIPGYFFCLEVLFINKLFANQESILGEYLSELWNLMVCALVGILWMFCGGGVLCRSESVASTNPPPPPPHFSFPKLQIVHNDIIHLLFIPLGRFERDAVRKSYSRFEVVELAMYIYV